MSKVTELLSKDEIQIPSILLCCDPARHITLHTYYGVVTKAVQRALIVHLLYATRQWDRWREDSFMKKQGTSLFTWKRQVAGGKMAEEPSSEDGILHGLEEGITSTRPRDRRVPPS